MEKKYTETIYCPICGSRVYIGMRATTKAEYMQEFMITCPNCDISTGYCYSHIEAVCQWYELIYAEKIRIITKTLENSIEVLKSNIEDLQDHIIHRGKMIRSLNDDKEALGLRIKSSDEFAKGLKISLDSARKTEEDSRHLGNYYKGKYEEVNAVNKALVEFVMETEALANKRSKDFINTILVETKEHNKNGI